MHLCTDSPYTRDVGTVRQRSIAVVLLAVLAGLPLGGTVCAALCTTTAASPASSPETSSSETSSPEVSSPETPDGNHHHHGNIAAHHDDSPSAQLQFTAQSGHDCNSHGTVAEALTASRVDPSFVPLSQDSCRSALTFLYVTASWTHSANVTPSAHSSPTIAPLVLRI